MDYDVLVIGSGPAGLEAARRIAAAGKTTALISESPAGGRATVGSLLPSKGWLHHANHIGASDDTTVREAAERIRGIVSSRVAWSRRTLEAAGVSIISGRALLTGPNSVAVESDGQSMITAERIVIAAGSEPVFFPGVKPDGKRLIAPRHTQHLSERPESLIMVGGGVTGVEYASVFARMGTRVRMLSFDPLLPRSDREYVERLSGKLAELGVEIETGVAVESAENLGDHVRITRRDGGVEEASYGFIATGRAGDPTLVGEPAPSLAVTPDERFVETDASGRTNIPSIYACGDVTGPPLTANKALLQARRVAVAISGLDDGSASYPEPALIEAVYTEPQLAQIGPVLELAGRGDVTVTRKSYAASMLGQVHGSDDGEIKIFTDSNGRILGASALGELASEILAPVQTAMLNGAGLQDLSAIPFAYPSFSEVLSF